MNDTMTVWRSLRIKERPKQVALFGPIFMSLAGASRTTSCQLVRKLTGANAYAL